MHSHRLVGRLCLALLSAALCAFLPLSLAAQTIRIAGLGANYGDRAANTLVQRGDITGTCDRLTSAQFNALSNAQVRAAYDVLIVTWASDTSLNVDWNTRLLPFLQAGGGVIFEDPNNLSKISAVVSSGSGGAPYSPGFSFVTVAGLTDGVLPQLVNYHMQFGAWNSALKPFIYNNGNFVGLYGSFGTGRIVVQGADCDYHADPTYEPQQYLLLKKEVLWVAQGSLNHAPVANAGADQTVGCDDSGHASVTLDGSASADQDNDPLTYAWSWTGGSASGATPTATFNLGTTVVTLTVTDGKGGSSTATVNITVKDQTPPVITAPTSLTAEATSAAGAVVSFSATAVDAISGATTVTATPASGSTFPLGLTSVALTATDSAGNTATKSILVNVTDTTPPAITTPAPLVVEATGPAGAAVSFSTSATDLVDGSVAVSASVPSGSVFPLGVTSVSLSATDAHHNTATTTFTVTVRDTTPPVIAVPANIVAEATSAAGAAVSFTTSAADLVDGSVAVGSTNASGSTFPLGTTTVTLTSTDAHHNTATATFTVTVRDTTPPALTVPADLVVEATSASGAVANFAATATDAVGVTALTYSQNPGSTFPIGTTVVSVSASDAAGNVSTGTFRVTVRDTTPPVITSLSASPDTLWAPNKKMVAVTLTAPATDAVGVASLKIVSVTTNEPDSSVQWQVTGDLALNLKADRLGTGTGRVYTITVEARDAAGNASQRAVTVTVPHDQRK